MVTLFFDKLPNLNNDYIISNGRRFKNKEACVFEKVYFTNYINERFKYKNFDASKNYFSLEITWHNPKFYTKKNEINKRGGDIDGVLKFLIDGIFIGINQDDSFLKELLVRQLPTENDRHVISTNLSMENLFSMNIQKFPV